MQAAPTVDILPPVQLHRGKERVVTANSSPTVHVWCPVTHATPQEAQQKGVTYSQLMTESNTRIVSEGDVLPHY